MNKHDWWIETIRAFLRLRHLRSLYQKRKTLFFANFQRIQKIEIPLLGEFFRKKNKISTKIVHCKQEDSQYVICRSYQSPCLGMFFENYQSGKIMLPKSFESEWIFMIFEYENIQWFAKLVCIKGFSETKAKHSVQYCSRIYIC